MRWEDLEGGNVPKDFLHQFFSSFPRETFINLVKIDPRFQKEFAGFRPEQISLERFAQRLAPYFFKERKFRFFLLDEWLFRNRELISTLESLSLSQLKKELSKLINKHGTVSLYIALLFDGRKGTEKLISQLWQEACQKKLWEDKKEEEGALLENRKRLEEAARKIGDLEEQRDRLYMEVEAEKNRRAALEDKFFSLKRENKATLERLKELENQNLRLKKELESIQDKESRASEYFSQIHHLTREIEKIGHELERERKNKEEREKEFSAQFEENKKLKKELFFLRHQRDLLQTVAVLPEVEERGTKALPGGFITVVCGEGDVPSSFFKIASRRAISLLVHTSRVRDDKLEGYLSRSHCVFLFGKQIPESLKEVVHTLCHSRQLPCYWLPLAKEEVFENYLKAACLLSSQKK